MLLSAKSILLDIRVFVSFLIFYAGKPAYQMYTSDVDWSPSVKLGHNKVGKNKLQETHKRALRSNAIKRKSGISQLSPAEVESTRKLANLRINVEHVIGATRQRYSILLSTLPIHFMTIWSPDRVSTVDKIVRVRGALNNLCVSVVPFS